MCAVATPSVRMAEIIEPNSIRVLINTAEYRKENLLRLALVISRKLSRLQDIFYYHGHFPVLKGVRLTEPRTEHNLTKEHIIAHS